MESKEINNILKQFNTTNTYKKIFINGAWGIGKSYYTTEYVNENKNNIVYISLFGKSSYEAIENAIAKELMNKLGKIEKLKKTAEKISEKINGSISLFGVSISTPEINRRTLIEEYSNTLDNKELIIIIDDLERKSGNILIEDIMGMIEEFATFEKIKIAIIGDEKNIIGKDLKKWQKFKEKIIEKEYKITDFSDDSIDNLVAKEVRNYIAREEIEPFINNYIKKHKVQNLRTIMKGINLFKEVISEYVEIKDNKRVNLMILKNCVSIVIENTEQIYKPNEKNKDKNQIQYAIDVDITSRIIHHYFLSIYVNDANTCVLPYILKIFNSDYNEDTIHQLNDVIKDYLDINEKEKSLFYLSESKITTKVSQLQREIEDNNYKFTSLDKCIDDFYSIIAWNDVLNHKYSFNKLSTSFNNILFNNYYDIHKYEYNNILDTFNYKRQESEKFNKLIDNYNKAVQLKYLDDKLKLLVESYKTKEYDLSLLEWLDMRLIQEDKQKVKLKFIKECKINNYFIPDIDGEIDEKSWNWIHHVWKIFYEKMNKNHKNDLNNYAENLKVDKLSSHRITILQRNKPLVIKEK